MNLLSVKNMFGLSVLFLALSFCACESEVINDQIELKTQEETSVKTNSGLDLYYLDNEPVPEGTYKLDDERLRVVVFGGSPTDLSDNDTHYYAFSTEELYLQFSTDHKLGLERLDAFERDMEIVNKKFGVGNSDGDSDGDGDGAGIVPPGYMEATQVVYDTYFGGKSLSQEKGLTILQRDCGNVPTNTMVMPTLLPALWGNWNNSVSEFDFVAIGGILVVYNWRWYRRRLATYVRWGFNPNCLPNGVDNRMSSGITWSF